MKDLKSETAFRQKESYNRAFNGRSDFLGKHFFEPRLFAVIDGDDEFPLVIGHVVDGDIDGGLRDGERRKAEQDYQQKSFHSFSLITSDAAEAGDRIRLQQLNGLTALNFNDSVIAQSAHGATDGFHSEPKVVCDVLPGHR